MLFSSTIFLALLAFANAFKYTQRNLQARYISDIKHERQLPTNPTGIQTITTPQNMVIRYKEPGKEGICETTPGVNSYSGYIELDVSARQSPWKSENSH